MTLATVPAAAPVEQELQRLLAAQRQAFATEGAPTLRERQADLDRLLRLVLDGRDAVAQAIAADFGNRSRHETLIAEIMSCAGAIRHARRHVKGWMRPRRRPVAWQLRPGRAWLRPQPKGVVGIIAPWNYPFYLAIAPLIGALAAGNRVMIKPSELTPTTASLLQRLIAEAFPETRVAVVTGGPETARAFAGLAFDHLLFTGSTAIGREVMRAAADNLVPVTLELGGKSPAIVAPDASLVEAAGSIAWGKLLNAGQTCIAPDYVLVPQDRLGAFADAIVAAAGRMYPRLAENPDWTAIINDRHRARLAGLVAEARRRGVETVEINPAGEALGGTGRMAPTLLIDPPHDLAAMREEIFGPVLPIVPYRTLDEAIGIVNARPRPLALYLFSHDRAVQERVLAQTTAGGVCLNDTIMHVAAETLPFGGIGASGIGAYHGADGFRTFSHMKPVLARGRPNGAALLRPPYGRLADRLLRFLLRP